MLSVTIQPAAQLDLVEHYAYLEENAGVVVAERFELKTKETFNQLSRFPFMGVRLDLDNDDLEEVRKWRVDGFDNLLIFYLALPDEISIVRVLHAASNWWDMLGYKD
jgi:toxin ParE1/3/4